MDGGEDFGVVDPTEIPRCDGQVGMAELALDDEERDPLGGHRDRVRVSESVRGEPTSDAGDRGRVVDFSADSG